MNLKPTSERNESISTSSEPQKVGMINAGKVRVATFTVVVICILISVLSCILAIWDFTKHDTLWRTFATCVVIASGMIAFGVVNMAYGKESS